MSVYLNPVVPEGQVMETGDSAQTPVRVVVAGELNAGKSAVINALVRDDFVPNFFGKEWRPAVVLRHGTSRQALAHRLDGSVEVVEDWDKVQNFEDVALCMLESPSESLQKFELIEIPFFHDGEVTADTLEFISSADILIWTTISSQAWRLSEKTILDQLLKVHRGHRILAVSRTEKLRCQNDRDRIMERLEDETADYFDEIFFMRAGRDVIRKSETDTASWGATNGEGLYRHLEKMVPDVLAMRDGDAPVVDAATAMTPTAAEPAEDFDEVMDNVLSFPHSRVAEEENTPELVRPEAPEGEEAIPTVVPPRQVAVPLPKLAQLPEEIAHLRPLVGAMHGAVGAVVLHADDTRSVVSGDDARAEACAEMAKVWRLDSAVEEMATTDGAKYYEAQVKMGRYTAFCRLQKKSGDVLVMLTDNTRITPGIAHSAFARMVF